MSGKIDGWETREAVVDKAKADEPMRIAELPLAHDLLVEKTLDKIQYLESSGGKNDKKCERIGGHNSYGFSQGDGRNFCLSSDNEVRKLVKQWILDRESTMTEGEMLCTYNIGIKVNSCPYYEKFKNI